MTYTTNFKDDTVELRKLGMLKLPKDNEHATSWCWNRRFEDGIVGYIQLLIYFDGSVKYSECTYPKLENGSYTERNVHQFDSIEHLIDDFK